MKFKKTILVAAMAVQIWEVLNAAPHFLTYVNFAVGGATQSRYYFSDSDMGQDLNLLGKYLRKQPDSEVILSYKGTAIPEYYGIQAQTLLPTGALFNSTHLLTDHPEKELFVISAAHMQGLQDHAQLKWINTRIPQAVLGHTLFVYDVTRDTEAHRNFAAIYASKGETAKADRQMRRLSAMK